MMLATLVLAATQLLYTDEPDLGIVPIPAALNEWTAPKLYHREKPTEADYEQTGPDFFKAEYGIGLGRVCPKGQDEAGLMTAWMMRREGVMDWRDIQKEAAEWLESVKENK